MKSKQTNHSKGILYLIGGGDEDYNSWSDRIFKIIVKRSNYGKIAVIYYKETDNWMCNYFKWLGADDAQHIIISNPDIANHPDTCRKIAEAKGIFIEGGHQRHYMENVAGTLAEQAIVDAYCQGKIIAGTSAGAMILSEVSFVSNAGRIHPEVLFRQPYLRSISINDSFLSLLPNALIDTHFTERDRLPRLLMLMARYWKEKKRKVIGIGIDEETVLSIGPDMKANVIGNGTVTLLIPDNTTELKYKYPEPPEITNLKIYRFGNGSAIDFSGNNIFKRENKLNAGDYSDSKTITGMNYLNDIILMSNLFDESKISDQQIKNLFQILEREPGKLGILLDSKSSMMVSQQGKLTFDGQAATILIDTHPITFRKHESELCDKHQPAILFEGILHCLHKNYGYKLNTHEVIQLFTR